MSRDKRGGYRRGGIADGLLKGESSEVNIAGAFGMVTEQIVQMGLISGYSGGLGRMLGTGIKELEA